MSCVFKVGPCCVGDECKHKNGELRPCHKCSRCNNIVHLLCAKINEETDEMTCDVCNDDERDSDGSRTLSEPVSGDETFKNTNISREKHTDPTVIEEMTVDIKGMDEEFTTITDSVSDNNVKKISKTYFVTKRQRINY